MIRALLVFSIGTLVIACCLPSEPLHCNEAKHRTYRMRFDGPMPKAWAKSDIWRVDPVTTIYFSKSCEVSVSHP